MNYNNLSELTEQLRQLNFAMRHNNQEFALKPWQKALAGATMGLALGATGCSKNSCNNNIQQDESHAYVVDGSMFKEVYKRLDAELANKIDNYCNKNNISEYDAENLKKYCADIYNSGLMWNIIFFGARIKDKTKYILGNLFNGINVQEEMKIKIINAAVESRNALNLIDKYTNNYKQAAKDLIYLSTPNDDGCGGYMDQVKRWGLLNKYFNNNEQEVKNFLIDALMH